ncbi:MAG TPA: LamG-like jellyroll fold domain-containing protein, partial [Pyrinomonadaceae bacterium]|nr:LamG-like jellyroll fold domain-containing protein [Pyrinomonadaceae bacterium]
MKNFGYLIFIVLFVSISNSNLVAQTACTPPPPGMIGWYAADGNGRDYSSTMNNATGYLVDVGSGPAKYAPGKVQRAFLLEGNNYVQTEPTNVQDPSSAATIDAWVLFNQKPSVAGRIMEIFSRGDFGRDLDLGALTDDKVYLYIANGQNVGTTFTIETGVWYHFAGTWDSTGLRIYVNGVLNNTNPVPNVTRNPAPGVRTRIGEGALFAERRFVGLIDEVELFDRALSPSEIQAIYNAGSFGKCKSVNNLSKYLDVDGDGRSDISLFRPDPDENNNYWYILRSSTGTIATFEWGVQTDKIAPADYDGDGTMDFAIWREDALGNMAVFYIYNSSNATIRIEQFGLTGDKLTVGDWDGDGKADLSVYRNGAQSTFFYRGSLNNPAGNVTYIPWGITGDKPVYGDYDADGKLDAAVFRPSNGIWYIRNSSNTAVQYARFGLATDLPVQADYDADGITDVAVYRPSEGSWYIQRSQLGFYVSRFGNATDTLVPADYDGDGKIDIAVFRNGTWYQQQTTAGISTVQFGLAGDKPIPAAYL